MADPVARPRVPDTEMAARAFEEKMIVGVQIVDLQKIVVNILDADLRVHAVETERFQGQGFARSIEAQTRDGNTSSLS